MTHWYHSTESTEPSHTKELTRWRCMYRKSALTDCVTTFTVAQRWLFCILKCYNKMQMYIWWGRLIKLVSLCLLNPLASVKAEVRKQSARSSGTVYCKLLSGLHCVPLCLWLTRGLEHSLVQAKVMSTRERHTSSHVTDIWNEQCVMWKQMLYGLLVSEMNKSMIIFESHSGATLEF